MATTNSIRHKTQSGRRHTGCSTPRILPRTEGISQHARRRSKNCALLAGFKRAFRFSHMNGTNNRGRTTKTEANPQTSKNDKLKEANDSHEDTDHFSPFTSHDSPFTIRYHSHRAYAWCVCTCFGPDGFRSCSGTRWRLSRRQYRRRVIMRFSRLTTGANNTAIGQDCTLQQHNWQQQHG